MTFKRRSGGTGVIIANIKRRSSGAWVVPANVYRRLSGAWVKVWTVAPSVTIYPASQSATSLTTSRTTVSSPTAYSASVTLGSGSYTYAWSIAFVPGSSVDTTGTCSISGGTGSTASANGQTPAKITGGDDFYAVNCVVTDTASGMTGSATAAGFTANAHA